MARALTIACRPAPPDYAKGAVVLVSVTDARASLWVLDPGLQAMQEHPRIVGMDESALRSWHYAATVLPRSLPVLWKSVRERQLRTPYARHLGTIVLREGETAVPEAVLAGKSFGLAFLLSMASAVLGREVPSDILATAVVRPDCRLGRVTGLQAKVRCAVEVAPRIRRLFVSAKQPVEDQAAAQRAGLKVCTFASGAEALSEAFPEMQEALTSAADDPSKREELTRSLFHLALGPLTATVVWAPVANAARLLLARRDLGTEERTHLVFAEAVARRHGGGRDPLPLPEAKWLARLPMPLRIRYVQHVVQQAADAGTSCVQDVERLAASHLRTLDLSQEGQLRLHGALARLWAVTGRARAALDRDLALARIWLDLRELRDVSYPLSTAFRLAGALQDHAAAAVAERIREEAEARGGLAGDAGPFIAIARGRMRAMLGDLAGARALIEPLCEDSELPDRVWSPARRWLIQLNDHAGTPSRSNRPEADLQEAASEAGQQGWFAKRNLGLVRLDRALRRGETEQAAACVRDFVSFEAQPAGMILTHQSKYEIECAARCLQLHYPY
ncbi:MAG: hypothetical protein HYZ53_09515 [Planctomycetes bacterium]|nr:hypothetical protein [Planctomycetota bacterium]